MAKTYSLFISHSWDHDDVLQNLKNLLDSRGYFPAEYTQIEKDCPINSERAWVVKANITKRLEQSDVVLAIAGIFASHSDWMQWEMDKAKGLGLNVIGVVPWGQEHISQEVYNRSVVDVRWNADSIVDAIRKYSK
jgi:hypothetical protein